TLEDDSRERRDVEAQGVRGSDWVQRARGGRHADAALARHGDLELLLAEVAHELERASPHPEPALLLVKGDLVRLPAGKLAPEVEQLPVELHECRIAPSGQLRALE